MPDPSVSPADTIRLLLSDLSEGYAGGDIPDRAEEAAELLDALLLAVGERDKAEIARLADRAVCPHCLGLNTILAADKEDADGD